MSDLLPRTEYEDVTGDVPQAGETDVNLPGEPSSESHEARPDPRPSLPVLPDTPEAAAPAPVLRGPTGLPVGHFSKPSGEKLVKPKRGDFHLYIYRSSSKTKKLVKPKGGKQGQARSGPVRREHPGRVGRCATPDGAARPDPVVENTVGKWGDAPPPLAPLGRVDDTTQGPVDDTTLAIPTETTVAPRRPHSPTGETFAEKRRRIGLDVVPVTRDGPPNRAWAEAPHLPGVPPDRYRGNPLSPLRPAVPTVTAQDEEDEPFALVDSSSDDDGFDIPGSPEDSDDDLVSDDDRSADYLSWAWTSTRRSADYHLHRCEHQMGNSSVFTAEQSGRTPGLCCSWMLTTLDTLQ